MELLFRLERQRMELLKFAAQRFESIAWMDD
jgi:hypothetical protein